MANKIIKNIRIGSDTYDVVSETITNMIDNLETQVINGSITAGKAERDASGNNIADTYIAKDDVPTISGKVTKAVGGIAANKTYTNASIEDVLNDLLFPYVAPEVSGDVLVVSFE